MFASLSLSLSLSANARLRPAASRITLALMLCLAPRLAAAQTTGYTVSGTVALEGISTSPIFPPVVTFTFVSRNHASIITQTPTLGAGGTFSLSGIPADNYTLSVKGDKWLRMNVPLDMTGGDVTMLPVALGAGDSNNDNSVDSSDFTALIGAFNSDMNVAGSGYDPTADFNSDGYVDSSDFTLLIGQFNNFGDEYASSLTTQVTSAGVVLTWQGSASATAYHVYRSTLSGDYSNATLVYSGNAPTFTDPLIGLPKAAAYYIVKAVDQGGREVSSSSNEAEAEGWSLYRVNCGGGGSGAFATDAYFTGGSTVSTTAMPVTSTVRNPAPIAVYQTARVGTSTSGFTYTFPNLTPGAVYTINVYLADFDSTASGQRQFNIAVNGTSEEEAIDIYTFVGNGKALQRQYTLPADSTGKITVTFSPGAVGSPICNGIEVLSAPLAAPTNLQALCTGDSKIALYWDAMPGATGYNIYRGLGAGGENYTTPINGATPVSPNSTSYPGSPTLMYSDTGLTNGTIYYYTIRAIYPTGISSVSSEDSEAPDSSGVPWDTRNSGSITNAIRNAYANDAPDINALHVVGPDGTIYDSRMQGPQPPDGVIKPGDNELEFPNGDSTLLPSPEVSYDSNNNFVPLVRGAVYWPGTHGPNRRVVSAPGFHGVIGDVYLSNPSVDPTTKKPVGDKANDADIYHGDTPEMHLGSHFQDPNKKGNDEVDAGVTYGPRGWGVYLRINGIGVSPASPKDPTKATDPNNPLKALFAYAYDDRIPFNTRVTMGFFQYPTPASMNVPPKRLCLITVARSLGPGGSYITLAGPSRLPQDPNKLQYLTMKRVHAIAQRFKKGSYTPPGKRSPQDSISLAAISGGYPTLSNWKGVHWGEPDNTITGDFGPGQLLDQNGKWNFWTQRRTYRTGFPAQNHEAYLNPDVYVGGFSGPDQNLVPVFGHIDISNPKFTLGPSGRIPDYYEEYIDIFCQP